MTGYGKAHGAVTVINAIPCGIGATIGIDLSVEAVFEVSGDSRRVEIVNAPDEDTRMAELCVSAAYSRAGAEEPEGWILRVDSEIPVSRGLKSSSSACNAIVSAVLDELGAETDPLDAVRLGVDCAREAGVTVTGAFDDACGCMMSGLVMTDNRTDTVITHRPVDVYDVVIHIPQEKIRKLGLPLNALSSKAEDMRRVVGMAVRDPFAAMTANGRLIADALRLDNSLAEKALAHGALGAGVSGTGPAVAMVVPSGEGIPFAESMGLSPESTIIASTRCGP